MEVSDDLRPEVVTGALPGRPVRSYPALLSTEADAIAWARRGAPHGAVVVADYQVSARAHGGLPWQVTPGRDLGFSVVMRPALAAGREGWMYTIMTTAIADVCGEAATIAWPDEVQLDNGPAAAVAVHAQPAETGIEWAVASVLMYGVDRPRTGALSLALEAIDARLAATTSVVLGEHHARCATLGRRVCGQLVPLGPNGRRVTGRAATTLEDGALVVETDEGRRLAMTPQAVGAIHETSATLPMAGDQPGVS